MALNHDEMKPLKINLPAKKTLQYPLHIDSLISIIIFNPHKYLPKQIRLSPLEIRQVGDNKFK